MLEQGHVEQPHLTGDRYTDTILIFVYVLPHLLVIVLSWLSTRHTLKNSEKLLEIKRALQHKADSDTEYRESIDKGGRRE